MRNHFLNRPAEDVSFVDYFSPTLAPKTKKKKKNKNVLRSLKYSRIQKMTLETRYLVWCRRYGNYNIFSLFLCFPPFYPLPYMLWQILPDAIGVSKVPHTRSILGLFDFFRSRLLTFCISLVVKKAPDSVNGLV